MINFSLNTCWRLIPTKRSKKRSVIALLFMFLLSSLTFYSPKISFSLFCRPWARRPRATILPCGSMSRLSGMLFTS